MQSCSGPFLPAKLTISSCVGQVEFETTSISLCGFMKKGIGAFCSKQLLFDLESFHLVDPRRCSRIVIFPRFEEVIQAQRL